VTGYSTTLASLDYTATCMVCGGDVTVAAGVRQGHRCRIDLDAQRAAVTA
jgi:hypothetical protein